MKSFDKAPRLRKAELRAPMLDVVGLEAPLVFVELIPAWPLPPACLADVTEKSGKLKDAEPMMNELGFR